ncbi:hypothetical protein EVJ58_g3701 [Rhodofomes roseus]|uniref:PWWP domain-containing protein n=1 Tax=Rhodofomes roseus TaxID=34475 RepID=A0A4Y9YJZ4_9APHY|nr:hypothetical protein EVJ58_g3701 [Rhodofomes roseus]
MPPRAAAQKASQLAAAQLESSPPPSDGREFGEPSKPRTPVKITYGRRRRGLSSPNKSSDGSPGKERSVGKRLRPSLGALASISAQKPSGSGSRAESPTVIMSEDETEDDAVAEPQSPLRRKADSRKADGGKRVPPAKVPSATASRKGKSNAVESNNIPTKRKRAISISSTSSLSDLDDSDLTPLSSPSPEASTMPPPRRARSASTLTSLTSSQISKTVGGLGRTDSVATLPGSSVADDEPWSLSKLGTLAWVRITGSSEVINESGDVHDGDAYWWPAKVTRPRDPVKVSLFGDGPRVLSDTAQGDLTVAFPSPSNILPMVRRGRIRFTERNYKAADRDTAVQASPRKRRKLDIDTRWKEARDLMLQEDEDANEGLPMLLSSHFSKDASFSVKAPSIGGRKAMEENVSSDDEDSVRVQEKPWRAPPCDPSLEVPGELVLAKEKKNLTDYWPAKLLEYIPPPNHKQRPRFKVEFYDGVIKSIDADWFFTVYDKHFKSCKLGRDAINYGLEEERDDIAAPLRNDASDMEIADEDALRPPTPEPPMPPLEDFEELTLTEQFEYVKPVLEAVIDGRFEPANQRHDQFMRGAAARRAVCESGYTRGSLKQDEVEALLRLVRRWATKKEKRRALGVPLGDSDIGPQPAEDGAIVGGSQVPSADSPVEKALTPVGQPADLKTEPTASGAEEPPSQLTLDADANAHEPVFGETTATTLNVGGF